MQKFYNFLRFKNFLTNYFYIYYKILSLRFRLTFKCMYKYVHIHASISSTVANNQATLSVAIAPYLPLHVSTMLHESHGHVLLISLFFFIHFFWYFCCCNFLGFSIFQCQQRRITQEVHQQQQQPYGGV